MAHVKLVGPGLHKLSDRSKRMVFIGYESGTKGYRLYDPSTNRLVVSRDVIFEENVPWNWDNTGCSTDQQVTDSFIVHYDETDQNPTIAENADNAVSPNAGAGSGQSADQGGVANNFQAPNSPITLGSNSDQAIVFATPPSQNFEETFGGPLRFRTLNDLLDSTDEIQDYDYSGVCLLAADEPNGVDDALQQKCWVDAMNNELQSIHENNTWYYADLPKGHKAIGLKWVYKVKRDPKGKIVGV